MDPQGGGRIEQADISGGDLKALAVPGVFLAMCARGPADECMCAGLMVEIRFRSYRFDEVQECLKGPGRWPPGRNGDAMLRPGGGSLSVAFVQDRGMFASVNAREFLATLCERCPTYQVPLPDCPLKSFRESGSASADSFAGLTDDEVDELVREHFLCVCREEGCGT